MPMLMNTWSTGISTEIQSKYPLKQVLHCIVLWICNARHDICSKCFFKTSRYIDCKPKLTFFLQNTSRLLNTCTTVLWLVDKQALTECKAFLTARSSSSWVLVDTTCC